MSDNPISQAFFEAVTAIGKAIGVKPLPVGINEATIGNWKLTLNTSSQPIGDHDPFTVKAENTEYIGFAIFDPHSGMIGGISEDQFIADMQAFNLAKVQ